MLLLLNQEILAQRLLFIWRQAFRHLSKTKFECEGRGPGRRSKRNPKIKSPRSITHNFLGIDMNFKKLAVTAASIAVFTGAAYAADQAGNANVEIVSAIVITETTEIDFGQIINVDGTCTMATGGSLSGTAGMGCSGTETAGQFEIAGTSGATVDVSVTAGSAVDGVTYNPVIDGAATRTLTGGTADVNVIGNIVLSSATDGVKDIAYTFTANYQ